MNKWFVDAKETSRIDLDDGEWIDIKTSISSSEQDFLANESMDVRLDLSQDEDEGKPQSRSTKRRRERVSKKITTAKMIPGMTPLLQVLIVAWSFKNTDGTPIPVTSENVGNLKREIANLVQDKWLEIDPLDEMEE